MASRDPSGVTPARPLVVTVGNLLDARQARTVAELQTQLDEFRD